MDGAGIGKVGRARANIERALSDGAKPKRLSSQLLAFEELVKQVMLPAERYEEELLFCYRTLAEVQLGDNPWKGALYIKRALSISPHDDALHALNGLIHAVMGHYKPALRAFERALHYAPYMPWYHHNLGHLLDVGLGKSKEALPHLRAAYESEPDHDELAASYASCLMRCDQSDEALEVVNRAVSLAPDHEGHLRLRRWIKLGYRATHSALRNEGALEDVSRILEQTLNEERFIRASALLKEFLKRHTESLDLRRPAVLAAAIEYTLNVVDGQSTTQRKIAEQYGVSASALSKRARAIQTTVDSFPGDPRFEPSRF